MKYVYKTPILFTTCLLLSVLTAASISLGEETREAQDRRIAYNNAHREMFATGAFAPMDSQMNKFQIEYEKGQWREFQVNSLFSFPFKGTDPAFAALYDEWLATHPKSYAAHQARGSYYAYIAIERIEKARGEGAISAADRAEAERYVGLAIKANSIALTFAKKPLVAYTNLIEVYASAGALDKSKEILQQVNKAVPKNIMPRLAYMEGLLRYGANPAEMQTIMEDIEKAGLAKKDTAQISSVFFMALLKNAQFERLDKELGEVQKSYEAGEINDITLKDYFTGFSDIADPALEEKYNAWIAAYPQSYVARQARALYLFNVAAKARGGRYMSDTSVQEKMGMNFYIKRALEDASAALSMTKKPLLAYYSLIEIYMVNGTSLQAGKQLLEKANETDPKNHIVRYKYTFAAQTRWGGNLQEVINAAEQAKKAGVPEGKLWLYEGLVLSEKGWLADRVIEGRQDVGQMQTGF